MCIQAQTPRRITLAVLEGDGIGPEVMRAALRVLKCISKLYNFEYEIRAAYVGGTAYDKYGTHLPDETLKAAESSDAILFGSVGGPVSESSLPKWKNCEINSILALRKHFQFAINLRPTTIIPAIADASPLKNELIAKGIDILIVRELIGDLYFGEKGYRDATSVRTAYDTAEYTADQIHYAAKAAFDAALKRRKKVCLVHKANVLTTSKLWKEVTNEVALIYPNVEYQEMLVDNCAMQLIKNPGQFDVVLTSNMFGDILSDEASVIPGSLGLCPSASINKKGFGLYEPSGGSAPDIAGQDQANPVAQILSLAMLLEYSFNMSDAASSIIKGVHSVYDKGYVTSDLSILKHKYPSKFIEVGTEEFASAVVDSLEKVD
jgi:3-isopropylmalate dehydrogenase